MDAQKAARVTTYLKSWINPPHPGRNKSLAVGLLMGFLLGPIGVALYLRSLVEGGLCVVAVLLVAWLTGLHPGWIGSVVAAAWAVGRILIDSQPPRPPTPEPAPTPTPTPTGPMPAAVA